MRKFSIEDILDLASVQELLAEELPKKWTGIQDIVVREVKIIKKSFHNNYYNLVTAYPLSFVEDGQKKELTIYSSAHSNESRKQTMANLQLIWQKGVPSSEFQTNLPLFYETGSNAFFYVGLPGINLYHFFHENERIAIEESIRATAKWLARLHRLTRGMVDWPEAREQRIADVAPGRDRALERIKKVCPEYLDRFARLHALLEQRELSHWPQNDNLTMIHGDLHPENVLVNEQGIAIIDWADASLGDPIRDLGSFMQQLSFMGHRAIDNKEYWQTMQKVFLETYQAEEDIKLPIDWQERLKTYYYFTAFRTAIYFVTKSGPEPERSDGLLNEIEANLN